MSIDCTTPILECLRDAWAAAPEHQAKIEGYAKALQSGELAPMPAMQQIGRWLATEWPAGLAHFEHRFPLWVFWWGQQCTAQG